MKNMGTTKLEENLHFIHTIGEIGNKTPMNNIYTYIVIN